MKSIQERIKEKPWLGWVLFFATVVIVFFIGMFASSIVERRSESNFTFQMVKPIGEWEARNEVWGENFPREFESYKKTAQSDFQSKNGGSVKIDILERSPEAVILWAGYAFSKDYNQGRGHANAIKDIRQTLRTGGAEIGSQPATCWTCKSPDVPRVMNEIGVAEFYKGTWKGMGDQIVNPIGCGDCHDSKTMDLKISRPALVEAFARRGKDITKATHQEMRSLVCAQCHVEYYFRKSDNYLFFPWDKGFSADSMEAYYDEIEFYDWEHPLSKAKMLKAQHPDYEVYMTGVHAERGVSCADCHMPYKSEGGVKFTDHHIQSPLNNIANSCQVCHREETERLVKDVYERQDKIGQIRVMAEKSLAAAHIEAKAAWDAGATEAEMKPILKMIRHAQFRWDWTAASNAFGFHSPVESLRILGTSVSKAEEARRALAILLTKKGVAYPLALPDISTKEKAQKYLKMDMEKFKEDKDKFLKTTVAEWDKKAKERQGSLEQY
jgi:nitrite reductase (cytochrome c-552)